MGPRPTPVIHHLVWFPRCKLLHMSKYEGMSQAANDFRERWSDHEQRCIQAAIKFTKGFSEYCSIPNNGMSFVPISDEERQPGTHYSLVGAMKLKEDLWWHVGLVISLSSGHRVLQELCFSEDKEETIIRLGPKESQQRLNFDDPIKLHNLYEALVNKVLRFFSADPRDRTTSPGKVGFDYVDLGAAE